MPPVINATPVNPQAEKPPQGPTAPISAGETKAKNEAFGYYDDANKPPLTPNVPSEGEQFNPNTPVGTEQSTMSALAPQPAPTGEKPPITPPEETIPGDVMPPAPGEIKVPVATQPTSTLPSIDIAPTAPKAPETPPAPPATTNAGAMPTLQTEAPSTANFATFAPKAPENPYSPGSAPFATPSEQTDQQTKPLSEPDWDAMEKSSKAGVEPTTPGAESPATTALKELMPDNLDREVATPEVKADIEALGNNSVATLAAATEMARMGDSRGLKAIAPALRRVLDRITSN